MLIDPEKSHLLLIDLQEKLVPIVEDPDGLLRNADRLVTAARLLEIPLAVSEQYPRGLGHTVPALVERLGDTAPMAKTEFSCTRNADLREKCLSSGKEQFVLAGVEAHICVLQTALGLAGAGKQVFVVADATSSRTPQSKDIALRRLAQAGVGVVTTEMVIFEWLQSAEAPAFRELSRLIR